MIDIDPTPEDIVIRKLTLAVGLGTGYVLGAKAGRERYEQIVSKARELAGQPAVQDLTSKATSTASELADKAKGAVSGSSTDSSSTDTSDLYGSSTGASTYGTDTYGTGSLGDSTYAADPLVDPLDDPAVAVVDLGPDTGISTGPMPGANPSLSEPDVLR